MKNRTRKTIAGLIVGVIALGSSPGAFAEGKEHPYQFIVARNPFALRPVVPPPKDEPLPAPPVPPLEIKLTGLSTLLGRALVFLEFTDPQTRKTARPAPMSEGDMYHGIITIVAIDAANSRVKIRNGAMERTLDFEKDGLKPAPSSVTPPVAPLPRAAVLPTPVPANSDRRVFVGGAQPVSPNPSPAVPTAPMMTRAEAEDRLAKMREFYQQQGSAAANIFPPGRSDLPNLPSPSRGLR